MPQLLPGSAGAAGPHTAPTPRQEGKHLLEMLEFLNSTSSWKMPPPPVAGCPIWHWEVGADFFWVCSLFSYWPPAQPAPWPAVHSSHRKLPCQTYREHEGSLQIHFKALLQKQLNCPQFCLLTCLRLKKYICYEGICVIAIVGLHCVVPSLPFQIQTLWG